VVGASFSQVLGADRRAAGLNCRREVPLIFQAARAAGMQLPIEQVVAEALPR